jgi:SAM-dependent methyltransferase
MGQYQSFPDARGDSRSLDKLKALRLPVLKERSFLDVGCNEGFFCGFAHFAGAHRVLGLDRSRNVIERARARFPNCEFRCQGWAELPDEHFDVILLASALHYAEDQPALLHALVDHLAPDGVLVLELGLVPSPKAEWVKVTRGIDQRWFPSLGKLREVLASHVLKSMALSVPQAGDPLPRYVVHISRRRPVAVLLLEPSASGKTTLATRLFEPSHLKVISGDRQISRIAEGAEGTEKAPPSLRDAAAEGFSRRGIDQAVVRIFERGQGAALVSTWLDEASGGDFVMEGYIPETYHEAVNRQLDEAGYMPVALDWQRPGQALYGGDELERQARGFFRSLRKRGAPVVDAAPAPTGGNRARGFVDRVEIESGKLIIRGWAGTDDGRVPPVLTVRLKGRIVSCDEFEVMDRADARKYLNVAEGKLGFRITLDAGDVTVPSGLGREFAVAPPGGPSLRMTPAVARLLGRG